MARTMDSDSLQLTIQRSSCWLQNAGDTPLFSEFDLRYAVADTNDPLSARQLTSFCSSAWSPDNRADQYYYSFTDQKDVHWIHNDKGYVYTTDGLPAWATLADSMMQELTTLPPKASMVNLEEQPPQQVGGTSKGFYNSPYYEVPVEGSVFKEQYPGFVTMGVRLTGVDIEDTTSISVPEACFYYALSFSEKVRGFQVFYQLRLQGERNGTPFDQVWQISISECTLGDPAKNLSFGPLSELTHLDGAAHFTEIDDPGLGYLFQDVEG